MAQWKKIIVSGSNAELASLVADSLTQVSNNQIISSSAADTKLSGSFSGSFTGDGSGLTGIVAASGFSLTQGSGIVPFSYNGGAVQTVSVSGSAQLSDNIITKWDATDGKFINSSLTDNGTIITGATSIQLTGANSVLTGSFQGNLAGTAATASYVEFIDVANKPTLVSGSSQIDLTQTTNYVSGIKDRLDAEGVFSSSAQLNDITLTGMTISGSFSGSFTGDGSGLSGLVTNLAISGSTGSDTVDLLADALTFAGGTGVTAAVTDNTVTISVQDATTTVKGIASFNSNQFTVSSGAVSLIDGANGAVLAINGTTNEVEVSRSNGTVTVGLPDNVIITQGITAATGSITGNLEVGGDLVVNGTVTTINTTNLEVKDRFILLNSGSTQSAIAKGGIVIDSGNGSGNAFIYNDGEEAFQRWGFKRNLDATVQSTVFAEAYAAAVITGNAGQFDGFYDKAGNIRVDLNGDIFIWA